MKHEDLLSCHRRIQPFIHKTPIHTSRQLDDLSGNRLFFKCENFQRMGAFKMRGAVNAILSLNEEQRKRGVVTHSSGNFAQAVALAARELKTKAYIVMPDNAPEVKKEAVVDYGGIITECPSNITAREEAAAKIVAGKGACLLHPSNQAEVILGQGTAALELLGELPDLDFIVVPVGGGGLLAGTAIAAHYHPGNCVVIGAEPKNVNDAYRSLKSGKIEYNTTTDTIADGLRTHLGDVNFPIIKRWVNEILLVEESEIIDSMQLIWERMKLVVEASSAVALAAVLSHSDRFDNKRIGIIISGGNVDLGRLPFQCRRSECGMK